MTCCSHCKAAEAQFGPKRAQGDLTRYRRKGPDATTRLMLKQIRAAGIRDASLLDIGAGIGVLHHELLGEAVRAAVHQEASPAFIALAREEDERRGNGGRVEYLQGDAAELGDGLPRADLVTLDRVICCYPEWERLVQCSAERAERVLALSMPHDRWYIRAVTGVENLVRRLRGNAFRTFVHPLNGVHGLLTRMGFQRDHAESTLVWHVALYRRGDK